MMSDRINLYSKFITEQVERSSGKLRSGPLTKRSPTLAKMHADAGEELAKGNTDTQPIYRAFTKHMLKHFKGVESMVDKDHEVHYPRRTGGTNDVRGPQFFTVQNYHQGSKNEEKEAVEKHVALLHDHYVKGAVDFYKSHGIDPEVREKGVPTTNWPTSKHREQVRHITALHHPDTGKHLVSIWGSRFDPMRKPMPFGGSEHRGEINNEWKPSEKFIKDK